MSSVIMRSAKRSISSFAEHLWFSGPIVVLSIVVRSFANPGLPDLTFDPGSGANNSIKAVALQNDGKIVIGGDFTSYNGTNRNHIARLNADGGLDLSFDPGSGADNSINLVKVLDDGRILIGGSFSSINGTSRLRAARLNSDGSLDTDYVPNSMSSPFANYFQLAVQSDGKMIEGGTATSGDYFFVQRRKSSGQYDDSFQQVFLDSQGGGPHFSSLSAAVADDGKILTGGDYFRRFHSNGSVDTRFISSGFTNRGVKAFAFQNDGKILIAGNFTDFGGVARRRMARLNPDRSVDLTFELGTGFNGVVNSVAIQTDGKVVAGGSFSAFNGVGRTNVARLNPDGSLDSAFDSGTGPSGGAVNAMATAADGRIVIVGDFTSVNGLGRNRIARLLTDEPATPSIAQFSTNQTTSVGRSPFLFVNAAGGQPLSSQWRFNGTNIDGATNPVFRMPNVQLTNAGDFSVKVTNLQGSVTSSAVTLSVQRAPVQPGSPNTAFSPTANSTVTVMARQPNGRIVIGGLFSEVNGVTRNRIAQLNPDGTLDASFDPGGGANFGVFALALQSDGKVLIGGTFTNVNGFARTTIARLNTDGSVDTNFSVSVNFNGFVGTPVVYALAAQTDGKVLVGGNFDNVGGTARYGLARLETNGVLDAGFQTTLASGTIVYSLALQTDGRLLASGTTSGSAFFKRYQTNGATDLSFSASDVRQFSCLTLQSGGKILGGFEGNVGVFRFSTNGVRETNFNAGWPNVLNRVRTVAVEPGGKILVGGDFANFNGLSRRHIVRLNPDGAMDSSYDTSEAADGIIRAVLPLPDGSSLIGGEFADIDGCERYRIARLNGDVRILGSSRTNGVFNATVQTDSGKNYILEFKDSHSDANWTSLPLIEGDGTLKNLTDSSASGLQRFYRVRIE